MDRIDGPTLFLINILLLLAIAVIVWGPGALLVAALIGAPLTLAAVVTLTLTARA
jgi:phosphoglycerol transferase MdoB-like AlkP superfamily enzyme